MTDLSLFNYNDGKGVVPSDHFRISPSQLSKFFSNTSQWYREHLLGEAGFSGSTSSELGNCVHAMGELFTSNQPINYQLIESYIDSIDNPEVDKSVIRNQYEIMGNNLIDYLSTRTTKAESELFIYEPILETIGVGGSIDRLETNPNGTYTIIDYKTMGSLDSARIPTSMPRAYWFQQMAYVWILQQQGKPVSEVILVYVTRNNTGRISEKTGKPMKDYISVVSPLIHKVTSEDLEIIDGILRVVAASVDAWNKQPELRHILSQDWRLRPPRRKFIKE